MTTAERILGLLRAYVLELNEDPAKVCLTATLDDIGIDSLMAVEFVFKLEEEFKVKLDANEMRGSTVGQAIRLVEDRLKPAFPTG